MKHVLVIGLGALMCVLVAACKKNTSEEASDEPASGTLANPASVHCVQVGGKLDMRETAMGVAGICVFPDGSECDEWKLFRGECTAGAGARQ